MNAEQLERLVEGHETQTLELKENIVKPSELADYFMQFANAQGGFVVFGMTHDRPPRFSGKIKSVGQAELDSISRAARECMRPPLDLVRVEVVPDPESGAYAILMEVPDSPTLHQHINGSLARRRGGEREAIYLDQEPSHVAAKTEIEYELREVSGTALADVDEAAVGMYKESVLERNPDSLVSHASDEEVLRGLGAIVRGPGSDALTVLGAVFFARDPQALVPQSKVLFVQFPGKSIAQPGAGGVYIHSEEVEGTIPAIIDRTERLLTDRLSMAVLADGFRVKKLPAVPRFALREAIVNALCHRDYALAGGTVHVRLFADRIEIQSPGGLPYPITLENIVTESYARNPRTADVLRALGYVERHGIGIDNMIRAMDEAHLPRPEFKDAATSFTVTLRLHAFLDEEAHAWLEGLGAHGLPEDQQRILVTAARDGRVVNSDVQSLNFVDGPEATRQLQALVRRGLLTQHGTRGAACYTVAGQKAVADLRERYSEHVLDELASIQITVLEVVYQSGRAKASDVVDAVDMDRRHIQRALAALVEKGMLVRHGKSVSDPSAFYEINADYQPPDSSQRSLF
ncbi:MAG: ATP-binding protein [Coriobacteriia bacterium]